METKSPFDQFDELRVDSAAKSFLVEAAKWTSFLAILGYIGIALMVVAALFMMTMGASMSSASSSLAPLGGGMFIGVIYLVFALLYFLPINYLYKFSSNMKHAISTNNQASLTSAFEYLKSHYKFIGIITLVVIGLYILMFLILMVKGVSSALM
ncbi:DUF5362 family protein [Chryseobacterium sp.]|uniref:DUF5362 family protein n=1 Tax=Chryseobacterium sp. TaxID=1871047 RepID=UPI002FCAAC9B